MHGSATSAWPTEMPESMRSENNALRQAALLDRRLHRAADQLRGAGWPDGALATTGQPAASAEAVSPPATEKARGKFEAPKTATGPTAIWRRRRSGPRQGLALGLSRVDPGLQEAAVAHHAGEHLELADVRPRSPSRRARGRPLSAMQRTISSSPIATMASATASRKRARSSREVSR